MEGQKRSSPNPFERLPDELNQLILSCIQDVFSLRSAVLSCRSLYSTFRDTENRIVSSTLLRDIPPTVLPEVIAWYDSLSIDPFHYKTVRSFIETHYGNDRSARKPEWNLRSAIIIANFRSLISDFTDVFVSEAGAAFPKDTSHSSRQMPTTPSETSRIQRSLYRYEIFCNIFRIESHKWSPSDKRRYARYDARKAIRLEDAFLSKFSPLENEQLACVYDLVVKIASPAYSEVASHDVECAARGVYWGDDGTTDTADHFQYFAASGLRAVQRLSRARTDVQRVEILSPLLRPRQFFIKNAFRRINGWRPRDDDPAHDSICAGEDDTCLDEFSEEERGDFVNRPFFDDPDPGPADAWRWAYGYYNANKLVDVHDQKLLRDWGYVMWDTSRLESSAIFKEPFWYSPYLGSGEEPIRGELNHDTEKSIATRLAIYNKGGRGWWSEGDQSRVVWTGSYHP